MSCEICTVQFFFLLVAGTGRGSAATGLGLFVGGGLLRLCLELLLAHDFGVVFLLVGEGLCGVAAGGGCACLLFLACAGLFGTLLRALSVDFTLVSACFFVLFCLRERGRKKKKKKSVNRYTKHMD